MHVIHWASPTGSMYYQGYEEVGGWVVSRDIAQQYEDRAEAERIADGLAKNHKGAIDVVPAVGEPQEHIEQFFAYGHLPPQLLEVSKPFADLAAAVIRTLPRNPERTVALRKLLEAKDAAVRAKLAK